MIRPVRAGRRLLLPAVVAVIAATAGSAAAPVRVDEAARPPPGANPAFCQGHGRQSVLRLPDRGAPGGIRPVWVYRSVLSDPAGPAAGRVPVLYFLHGLPGSAFDLPAVGAAAIFDHIACVLHRPFVVAAPDGNAAHGQDTEWGDDAHGAFSVETFVTGPLIRAVEGTARRDRQHRAIFGFSMGGYGAVTLALRHPQVYGAAASISGYFKIDDPDGVFGADDAGHDPTKLVARARSIRLMLAQGAQDDEPVVRGELARFAALLRAAGTPAQILVVPGGHDTALLRALLPQVTLFLLG